ncbi:DUF1642 domain-containing protein [Lactococcus lactis]|uniref:DUF1642 domain-containing protein n=1 Tax=Lactococcus lactis TaxID=1358 RepID=UPI003981C7EE
MNKFEEELMATAKMIPTSDGNEIKFKTSSALYDYLLLSNGEAELYLESQLQQQALPVVPECVGEWIDKNISVAHNAELMIHNILICAIDNKNRYLFPLEVEKFVLKNPITFLNAVITGKYQVEKPQLFYLRDELTGQFLAKDNQFKDKDRYFFWTGADPLTHSIGTAWKLTFTQQEIDSMETGSYELVPVEDGE